MDISGSGKKRENMESYGSVSKSMMSPTAPRPRRLFKAYVYSGCCFVGLAIVFFALLPSWEQEVTSESTTLCVCVSSLYFGLEVFFALWVYCVIVPEINSIVVPPKPTTPCREHIHRTIQMAKRLPRHVYTIEQLMRGYFLHADIHDVQLDNYYSFFAYALFSKHLGDLTSAETEEVTTLTTEVVKELLSEMSEEDFKALTLALTLTLSLTLSSSLNLTLTLNLTEL